MSARDKERAGTWPRASPGVTLPFLQVTLGPYGAPAQDPGSRQENEGCNPEGPIGCGDDVTLTQGQSNASSRPATRATSDTDPPRQGADVLRAQPQTQAARRCSAAREAEPAGAPDRRAAGARPGFSGPQSGNPSCTPPPERGGNLQWPPLPPRQSLLRLPAPPPAPEKARRPVCRPRPLVAVAGLAPQTDDPFMRPANGRFPTQSTEEKALSSGCRRRRLRQGTLFLTVLRAPQSKVKVPAMLSSVGAPFSLCPHRAEVGGGILVRGKKESGTVGRKERA